MATRGHRFAVLLGAAAVLLLTAWFAGSAFDPPGPQPSPGSVRLGPEPGEVVEDYLARLPAELPDAGEPVLALVQLDAEVPVAQAVALTGQPVVTAVFRVPLPRVQTALRFVDPPPELPPGPALDTARRQAAEQARRDADRLTARPGAVAAAEARALADPSGASVAALLVRADRDRLTELALAPGVRAVHAAPAGAVRVELALTPLLPGQWERADPVPDDGPVRTG